MFFNYTSPERMTFIQRPAVFLAGGISGTPDWQKPFAESLKDFHLTVFNPRRESFDVTKKEMSEEQIQWEFVALWNSDIIVFWFTKETACPITLFELGVHLTRSRLAKNRIPKICIGVEPGYVRELDVRTQAKFLAPDVPIMTSLEEIKKFVGEATDKYNTEMDEFERLQKEQAAKKSEEKA